MSRVVGVGELAGAVDQILEEHPELLYEIDRKVREHYGLDPDGARQVTVPEKSGAEKSSSARTEAAAEADGK